MSIQPYERVQAGIPVRPQTAVGMRKPGSPSSEDEPVSQEPLNSRLLARLPMMEPARPILPARPDIVEPADWD